MKGDTGKSDTVMASGSCLEAMGPQPKESQRGQRGPWAWDREEETGALDQLGDSSTE